MFVYTVKSKQIRAILIILFIVLTTAVLVFLSKDSEKVSQDNSVSYKAGNHSERMSFISQFGWEVSEEPIEVREVIIPEEFDEVYSKYNDIQLSQGLDLTAFKGVRVKRWTYSVKNYAGYESKDCIRINLLIAEGKVIGGDVCSTEIDGFMHGFQKSGD